LDDPLNLMRVMPTQGGQPCAFPRMAFLFAQTNNESGKHEMRKKSLSNRFFFLRSCFPDSSSVS